MLFLQLIFVVALAYMLGFTRGLCRKRTGGALGARALFSSKRYIDNQIAVHVRGKITPGGGSSFYEASLVNAQNSITEGGIGRFDVLKLLKDKEIKEEDEFLLIEVYSDSETAVAHKETQHYNTWRESVAPLMKEARTATKFKTLFPPSKHWSTSPSCADFSAPVFASALSWDAASEPFYTSTNAVSDDAKKICSNNNAYSHRNLLAVVVDVHVQVS
mgnify:CR=1 FL=1